MSATDLWILASGTADRMAPHPFWVRRSAALLANPVGALALLVLFLLLLATVAPRAILPYGSLTIHPADSFLPPSAAHPAGTDALGRDVTSVVVYGARTTLWVGAAAILVALTVGASAGLVAGFWGGSAVDELIMRLVDVVYVFPSIVLALTVVAVLGPDRIGSVAVALALGMVPGYARLVRSRVLSIREEEFIAAARGVGATTARILRKHIVPHTVDVLLVRSVAGLSGIILAEATLSFLGLGVQPPNPSWGRMLRESFRYLASAPWLTLMPALAIFLTVFAVGQVGEAIRAGLHPRAATRGHQP
jgi:peptide/nickel transport system permease protein